MNKIIETVVDMQASGFSSTVYTNKGAIFNNGQIGITKDLIFGLCVWTGTRFEPIESLDLEDRLVCRDAVLKGTHPFPWTAELDKLIEDLKVT